MNNEIVKNRVLTLKLALIVTPLLAVGLLGFGIWLLTLLSSPHANPDVRTQVIATGVVMITLSIFLLVFSILVIPRIIKKAEKSLEEYQKMKDFYEKNKQD